MEVTVVEDKKKIKQEEEKFRCLRHENTIYHDIFLSYRVNTEKKVADKLALLLDASTKENGQKVRTFLDSNCLLDGGDWERNFLSALNHSKLVVLIISESGLDMKSATDATKTKIQNADHEQDNCLLEYEYAINLKEKGKAELLVICMSREAVLDGTKCMEKFPTSPPAIEQRLSMYSRTGEHLHRPDRDDKEKKERRGPLVSTTMGKLLWTLSPPAPKGDPIKFLYMDPDDISSRVPLILRKLKETEAGYTLKRKWRIFYKDVAYLKVKIFGLLCGMILPVLSMLSILNVTNPRHKAYRIGVILGHGLDLLALSIWLFTLSVTSIPKTCGSYKSCLREIEEIAFAYDDPIPWKDCDDECPVLIPEVNGMSHNISDPKCSACFCDEWLTNCDDLESNTKAYLFLGLLAAAGCITFLYFTKILMARTGKKKSRGTF